MDFAKTKWGKQWIHSILKIGRPFRMQRGIQYAEDDKRIENLIIKKGQIFATVQGTAPTPYRVKINFEIIPDEGWQIITKQLSDKTLNLINLLEGDLPENIMDIFRDSHYPLFLDAEKGLDASCSCPDKAVPCKHIASIILYVALVLDFNPFILLKLRGKSKDEILSDLNLIQKGSIDNNLNKTISEKRSQQDKDCVFAFNVPEISVQEILSKPPDSGAFQEIGFIFKKPTKHIETLENLGLPSNLDNPKAFETVMRAIYRTITTHMHTYSYNLEKG